MTGPWTIIVPQAGTNLIINPSAETTGNYAAHASSTVTRDTTYARFGDYSYKVVPGGINRGISLTTGALAAAIHYATFYVHGTVTGILQVSLDAGSNYNAAAIIGGSSTGWVRYGVSIAAIQASGSVATIIRDTGGDTIYYDGIMLQELSHASTYIDGDLGPLYRWTGQRHASTSTRDAQDRSGGWERNLLDDAGIKVRQMPGAGMAPVVNNLLPQSLLPGSVFQSGKVQDRHMTLVMDFHSTTGTLPGVHSRRRSIIDYMKSDKTRGNQPFWMGYTGANSGITLYAQFRYESGLGLGKMDAGPTFIAEAAATPVGLVSVDPFWYEDSMDTASLDFQNTLNNFDCGGLRKNGVWQSLGTGLNNQVVATAIDHQRNRIYFGGQFASADGASVNRICFWNGTTFENLEGGVGTGVVYGIAVAPNGDVWVAGTFTTVGTGAAATKGLARWNISTSTWTAFNESTGSFNGVYALTISKTGVVYIAGDFTNWEGDAASDYIASTSNNGVDWDPLGTSPFSSTKVPSFNQSMVIDANGVLWVGERQLSGTATTSLRKWDGSTWTTVLTTDSSSTAAILALYFMPNGDLMIGGRFSTLGGVSAANIATYNGTSVFPLGSGVSGGSTAVFAMALSDAGLLVGGIFTTAGGLTIADYLALWNGYVWTQTDVDLPSVTALYTISVNDNGDIYVGGDFAGGGTVAGITTVTPTGTAAAFLTITFIATTTTGSTTTLQWIENISTGQRLYFNLTALGGETITIDMRSGRKLVTSNWRGVIQDQPLSGSDFANFYLLPGDNTISAFVTGTDTGAALLVHTQPRHSSVDMVST